MLTTEYCDAMLAIDLTQGTGGMAPVNVAPPVISGMTVQGNVLSVTTGSWLNVPTSYAYQWRRAGTPIGGATASTYTLAALDVGDLVDVVVTATNGAGSTPATAAAVGPVTAPGRSGYRILTGVGAGFWSEGLATCRLADGRTVVVGADQQGAALAIPFVPANFRFLPLVVMLDANGDLDTTFASVGWSLYPNGVRGGTGIDWEATDVYQEAGSGKLVIGFTINDITSGQNGIGVMRLNLDGSLDTTFNAVGYITFPLTTNGQFYGVWVAPQALAGNAGKVVCGTTYNVNPASDQRFVLTRLLTTGVQDVTFNGTGAIISSLLGSGHLCQMNRMRVDQLDHIYACGWANDSGGVPGWYSERYLATGFPDTSWGGAGVNANGVRHAFANPVATGIVDVIFLPGGDVQVFGSTAYDVGGHLQLTTGVYQLASGVFQPAFNSGAYFDVDYHGTLQANASASAAVLLASSNYAIAGGDAGNSSGQGFSDTSAFLAGRYSGGATPTEAWHTQLPTLGTSSMVWYAAGGPGFPAGPATAVDLAGHTMDDVASPRHAVALVAWLTAGGALDTTKGQ